MQDAYHEIEFLTIWISPFSTIAVIQYFYRMGNQSLGIRDSVLIKRGTTTQWIVRNVFQVVMTDECSDFFLPHGNDNPNVKIYCEIQL